MSAVYTVVRVHFGPKGRERIEAMGELDLAAAINADFVALTGEIESASVMPNGLDVTVLARNGGSLWRYELRYHHDAMSQWQWKMVAWRLSHDAAVWHRTSVLLGLRAAERVALLAGEWLNQRAG